MRSRWQQRHHEKLVIELVNLVLLRLSLEGDAVHAPSNVPVLPEGQPHPEHHLGSAKDPHAIRLLDEPHRDPTGALGADHPQPRMLLGARNSMSPSPSVTIAKASTSLLFQTAPSPLVFVHHHELADSTTSPVRSFANFTSTAFSGGCTPRSYAPRGRR